MKSACLIFIALIVTILAIVCVTYRSIANDLLIVTSGATKTEIRQYFAAKGKKPVFVHRQGERLSDLGWNLPNKEIDFEMEIYDSSLAVRIYVYYDQHGIVTYVYSSSS